MKPTRPTIPTLDFAQVTKNQETDTQTPTNSTTTQSIPAPGPLLRQSAGDEKNMQLAVNSIQETSRGQGGK
jgi:hypothetical protein